MFLPSLLRSPGPSVAIFGLHAEWEERTEGGHRTGTRRGDRTEVLVEREGGEGRGGEETKLELREPCVLRVVVVGRWSPALIGSGGRAVCWRGP